jgi:hypothetical protein
VLVKIGALRCGLYIVNEVDDLLSLPGRVKRCSFGE